MNIEQIDQSDVIMDKLGKLRSAIHQHSNQGLNQYLPREPMNSRQIHHEQNSYRKSLEKKLQRLFKQEKQMFSEGTSFHQQQENQRLYTAPKMQQNFTVDKMEQKIKELEKKYLHIQKEQPSHPQNLKPKQIKQQNNKSLSVSMKPPMKQSKKIGISPQKAGNSEKKIKNELNAIKKQINSLSKMNEIMLQKMQRKQDERKQKKISSKQLLRQIVQRLGQIRRKMESKCSRKNSREPSKISQNMELIQKLEQITEQLKRQTMEKQNLQQKYAWITNQIKLLNNV